MNENNYFVINKPSRMILILKNLFKKTSYVFVILLLYQVLSLFTIIPSLKNLLDAIITLFYDKEIYIHIYSSFLRMFIGISFGVIIGISTAILAYRYEHTGNVLKIIIEITRPIPPIAWIPLSIILFGIGNISSYFIVFLGCFFPIFTNTYSSFCSIPKIIVNTSKTFKIEGFKFYYKILLPYSIERIFSGIKIGIGTGWMSVIAAEMISTQSGLGYFIQINRLMLNIENIIIGMLIIGLLGYLLVFFTKNIEKYLTPWKR